MADTLTYVERPVNHIYLPSELNTIFTNIKTLIDGKMDVRGFTIEGDMTLVDGGAIINVPPAENVGDIIPYGDRP